MFFLLWTRCDTFIFISFIHTKFFMCKCMTSFMKNWHKNVCVLFHCVWFFASLAPSFRKKSWLKTRNLFWMALYDICNFTRKTSHLVHFPISTFFFTCENVCVKKYHIFSINTINFPLILHICENTCMKVSCLVHGIS